MGLLFNELAITPQGYNITNSLRFQSASSTYLARTPASATSRTVWTWSAWVKRGSLGGTQQLLCVNYTASQVQTSIYFNSDAIEYSCGTYGVSNDSAFTTSQVFRDPSAWYHLVLTYDSTQGTNTNRLKFYVNGSQVTAFSSITYPSSSFASAVNNTVAHNLGRATNASQYFDGYMTEINLIDGQALTPSSFGETNTLTGQWVAKKYTGTYGTNGFYLPFSNGTSTTTLGYDSSGNGNNWTLNNFTRSAGVSDCWMYDVPSGNGSAGTQPNSNYAVGNPLNNTASGNITFSKANIALTIGVNFQWRSATATMSVASGKWYWEVTKTNSTTSGDAMLGIVADTVNISGNYYFAQSALGYSYIDGGNKINSASSVAYGSSWTINDVIGIAFDADTGQLTFYKNGVSQGLAYTVTSGYSYYPAFGGATSIPQYALNFGQRSFAYTPPSGFKALCTANLPTPVVAKGNQHFDVNVYVGDGSASRSITNSGGFAPGFIWHKDRSSTFPHRVWDVVRGATNFLDSASTGAESVAATGLLSFDSTGFTVGTGTSVNGVGLSIAAWQWNAGSSTVTNTSGTISSQVRANPTAGVSVVTWTGAGSAATVGHGLGVAPKMFITKRRDTSENWNVYHASVGNTAGLSLNITNAAITNIGYWNNTSPTANTLSIGTYQMTNGATYVGYVFAEIAGFSKFGSYTGNSNPDGAFVYTGFRPKYIMIKRTDSTSDWVIKDTSRSLYNVSAQSLQANLTTAETATDELDILSNGFKLRHSAASGNLNTSGGTYIYMAFAESPFNYSNAR